MKPSRGFDTGSNPVGSTHIFYTDILNGSFITIPIRFDVWKGFSEISEWKDLLSMLFHEHFGECGVHRRESADDTHESRDVRDRAVA